MKRQFKSFLLKILLLTSIIVGVFNIWWSFIKADKSANKNIQTVTNNENFRNTWSSQIWKTWVAISTNLWIRFKQRSEIPATIYKDVFSINELKLEWYDANNLIIASNMIITQEYKNILRSDIKWILDSSRDRASMLNALIDQLEYRYEKAVIESRKLLEQKKVLEWEVTKAASEKNAIVAKIDSDFKANNAKASAENIKKYLEIQNNFYYARTYIVYINQFLREYQILNDYNKKLLDTLINNKNAIIKDAYVVIPDTWTDLLRQYNLLIEEADYKSNR